MLSQALVSQEASSFDFKMLEVFLENLTKLDSYISIKKETETKHQTIINFLGITLTSYDFTKHPPRLQLGVLVLNNILAMHLLFMGQPNEKKTALIRCHANLFKAALKDFFLDAYNQNKKIFAEGSQLQKLPPYVNNVIDSFVTDCINLDFNPEYLKKWIVRYAFIGAIASEFNKNVAADILKDEGLLGFIATMLSDFKRFYVVSYGHHFAPEYTLVYKFEHATRLNLRHLLNSNVNLKSEDLGDVNQWQKTWDGLYEEQFESFRNRSRFHLNGSAFLMLSSLLVLGLLSGGGYYHLNEIPYVSDVLIVFMVSTFLSLLFLPYNLYKYNRIILSEYKQKDEKVNTDSVIRKLARLYTPEKKQICLQVSNVSSTFIDTWFLKPTYEETSSIPKNKPKRRTTVQTVEQPKGSKTKIQSSEIAWTGLDGKPFHAPTYYFIRSNLKNAHYGYLSQEALETIKSNLSNKKKNAFDANISSLFKVVRKKGEQGIVFFDSETTKKYNAHSKIKFTSKELGKFRIFGHVVAKGQNDEVLIEYYRAREPKHKKKSN